MDKFKKFAKDHAPELLLGTVAVAYVAVVVVAYKRTAAETRELNALFEECYKARDFSRLPDNQLWIVPTRTLKELTS